MSTLTPKTNPNASLTVNPPRPLRLLMSWMMNRMIDPDRREKNRHDTERKRQAAREPHRVHYFHQLDDPYSLLSAGKLAALSDAYDIEIVPHLIRATGGKNQPYPEELAAYARRDAEAIAPHYGLRFPGNAGTTPSDEDTLTGARILAGLTHDTFLTHADEVSEAVWSGDSERLDEMARTLGAVSARQARKQLEEGSKLLEKMGHYSGATFFYGGEWYWGVDRLYHLEQRLEELGARKEGSAAPVAPRPAIETGPAKDTGRLTLEIFPSLRSPYTAVIFDTACEMADTAGINLVLRPVLPMVMRGVPATRTKGVYIFSDAKREADALGVPFAKIYDPIGDPVRRAYSLYPWAASQGKGRALLSSFLKAAFVDGIRTDTDRGLRKVVEEAGLEWADAENHLGSDIWETEIAENQRVMTEELGLWGVPSFRLRGPEGEPDFSAWGQDRLWLVAAEIKRRLAPSG
ncbi:MAG: DsbA family protein [Parvibaculaceae bacterium]